MRAKRVLRSADAVRPPVMKKVLSKVRRKSRGGRSSSLGSTDDALDAADNEIRLRVVIDTEDVVLVAS